MEHGHMTGFWTDCELEAFQESALPASGSLLPSAARLRAAAWGHKKESHPTEGRVLSSLESTFPKDSTLLGRA